MERDYVALVAALRRKAADRAVTPEESALLTEKANELAKKHKIVESNRRQQAHEIPFLKTQPDVPFTTVRTYTFYYHPASSTAVYDSWLSDLDERPENNGNYEFPQEENFSE